MVTRNRSWRLDVWAGKPPVDRNNQDFKDWKKNIFDRESKKKTITILEEYKGVLRSVGQMSTEEIAAVDVNDGGFKGYAKIYHKEAYKEIMVGAEQAAESATTASCRVAILAQASWSQRYPV